MKLIAVATTAVLFSVALCKPPAVRTQTPQHTLDQYVADLQSNPNDTALRQKIIAMAQTMNPPPPIPEDARRHYVMAMTFAEKAKSDTERAKDDSSLKLAADELKQAVGEYSAALLAAPWWADVYKKLAVAQEAAGQFDDAIASLNLYLLTQPADARDAQDEIYKLEADKQAAAQAVSHAAADEQQRKQQEEQQRALEAQRTAQAENDAIAGRWKFQGGNMNDAASHAEFHMEGNTLVQEVVFDQDAGYSRAGSRRVFAQYQKVGDRRFQTWNGAMQASITLEFTGDTIIQTIPGGPTTFYHRLP